MCCLSPTEPIALEEVWAFGGGCLFTEALGPGVRHAHCQQEMAFSLKKPLFCLLLSYQSEERGEKIAQSRDKGRRGSHPNPVALPSHRVEA